MANPSDLDKLLNDIRTCHTCRRDPCDEARECVPFAFGKATSDIFVLSQNPPPKLWRVNTGNVWIRSLSVTENGRDAPSMVSSWLGLKPDEADRRLFWIQRANCFSSSEMETLYDVCSRNYIHRAILVIKPRIILALGLISAGFITGHQGSLEETMQSCLDRGGFPCSVNGTTYPCVVFSHPSWRNDGWRKENAQLHSKAALLANRLIQQGGC